MKNSPIDIGYCWKDFKEVDGEGSCHKWKLARDLKDGGKLVLRENGQREVV